MSRQITLFMKKGFHVQELLYGKESMSKTPSKQHQNPHISAPSPTKPTPPQPPKSARSPSRISIHQRRQPRHRHLPHLPLHHNRQPIPPRHGIREMRRTLRMEALHGAIHPLRHHGLMHRQRLERARHAVVPHRHELVRLGLLRQPPPVVRVQRHRDVVVLVQRHHDHLAVFGVDGAEAGVGPVLVREGCVGGAGTAAAAAGDEVLLVVRAADDHAWFEHFFRESDALVSLGFGEERVALVRGEAGLLEV